MAGASDRARSYLERYVPELQEYERKGIFTREEIAAIASRRNDFEHTLNARGSKPGDYANYATYEMNLDNLRKKRSKRVGVKAAEFNGQRIIFFIMERATKKFPGDMGLWMQYINFCRHEKSSKRLDKVFTNVLRLKPREVSLWVLAAKYYAEDQGDMTAARSYMQRGLRFCKDQKKLWLEYIRLEMLYLAKLAARRKILGLDEERKAVDVQEQNLDSDILALPEVTANDFDPEAGKGLAAVDAAALEKMASAPAFTGAIPMAIFDAATTQFDGDITFAEEVFNAVASFETVPSSPVVLHHIIDFLLTAAPQSVEIVLCKSRLHLRGIAMDSVEFPAALGEAIAVLNQGWSTIEGSQRSKFSEKSSLLFQPYLQRQDELDEDVAAVIKSTISRYSKPQSKLPRG